MAKEYSIKAVDSPEWELIGGGIAAYNQQQAGDDNSRYMCFVLLGPDGDKLGGVIAATHWDWLYIDLMWLPEEVRGRGFGRRLLAMAEQEARQRGAKRAYLDTFSFQAPDFYEKCGYRVFGELTDFPMGQARYYMMKELS